MSYITFIINSLLTEENQRRKIYFYYQCGKTLEQITQIGNRLPRVPSLGVI